MCVSVMPINLCFEQHKFSLHWKLNTRKKEEKEEKIRKCFSYIKSVWLGFYVSRLHWRRLVSNFKCRKWHCDTIKRVEENDLGDGPLSLIPSTLIKCWLMKFKAEKINWHNFFEEISFLVLVKKFFLILFYFSPSFCL